MRILKIDKKTPLKWITDGLESNGIFITTLAPAPLSAVTALKAGLYLNRADADIIEASDIKNATAAISAAKISKTGRKTRELPFDRKRDIKVTVLVEANSKVPKSIPAEVLSGVNLWLFQSQRLMDLYPENINKKHIGVSCDSRLLDDIKKEEVEKTGVKKLLWIGDIEDKDKLRFAIDSINDSNTDCRMRICGTGKASEVMPVVKYSRGLPQKERIEWLGQDFNPAHEIAAADIVILSGEDANGLEAAAALCGKPLVSAQNLSKTLDGTEPLPQSGEYPDITTPEKLISEMAECYKLIIQKNN